MQTYFKEEFFLEAKKQRRKNLIFYCVCLALYLLIGVFIVIIYRRQPYNGDKIVLIKIINGVLAGIFVIFSFIFFGIPFKRVNKFYKMCVSTKEGLTSTSVGNFVEVNEDKYYKDGVDMKRLTFLEWSDKRQDYYERTVLVLYEKPLPNIPKGKDVKYVTKGNILLEYEILEGEVK